MPIILCLDPGTAHTGIAVSYEGELANPLATIFEKDLDRLVGKLIPYLTRLSPDKIVIGTPDHGPLISFAKELSERIKKIYLGEVVLFEEDLSSSMARQKMKEAKKTLYARKKEEHQTAAALILQDYLESSH